MSWDPYIQSLTDNGFYDCCIAGHDALQWAQTPSFKLANVELQTFCRLFTEDSEALKRVVKRGFTLQSIPYALTRLDNSDDDAAFLIGRCKEHGAPTRGVIVARTAKTIIVGIHDPIYAEGVSFGKAYIAMFQLAESLAGMNF